MLLVEAVSAAFSYPESEKELFTDLSFSIYSESRIGLVGENGSGKSTLIELIRGGLEPQAGKVVRARGLLLGGLSQNREERGEADSGPPAAVGVLRKAAAELGLAPEELDRPFEALSGGDKTKALLARLLGGEPDLLLLDEPTNHLDEEGRRAVEAVLSRLGRPFIVVSHDRRFLDETVSEIWELRDGKLTAYSGNYSFYRRERELAYRKKLAAYERTRTAAERLAEAAREKKSIACKMEKFKASRSVKRNGGLCKRDDGSGKGRLRPDNAMRSATAIEARLERLEASEEAKRPEDLLHRRIRADAGRDGNRRVLSVQDLAAGYDGKLVFSGLGFDLRRGERLAVRGKNGSGKTTLFRVLLNDLPPAAGRVLIPPSVQTAYLAQELENLDPEATLLETVMGEDFARQTKARLILADFGLTGDSVFRRVNETSVGERTKTAMARVIFTLPDLFVLDEPTNHLEPEALEALEVAFQDFPGGVIYASHDRTFVENTATRELNIEEYGADRKGRAGGGTRTTF